MAAAMMLGSPSSFLQSERSVSPHRYSSSASPSPRRNTGSRSPVVVRCKGLGETSGSSVDRRDLLLGLGGLYGATLALNSDVLAAPVTTPEISKCRNENIILPAGGSGIRSTACCPPTKGTTAVDYEIPRFTTLRERSPAHALSPKQLRDYETAVANSKKMDQSDPRSYEQQAKIHCAYCNGGYDQVGFPDVELQVHTSWLFLPFHRWYLYFYERILGKLCSNEDFGLPFWNWDNPPGMNMPSIFLDPNSPLYDKQRDFTHLPPAIVDLDNADNEDFTSDEQIEHNLWVMYRTMISQGKTASCFHGARYVGGSLPNPGPGTIELPHNLVHRWTGNPGNPYSEDMGAFYSAGYDPIFYSHHANVDRAWSLFHELGRKDFTDPDWLNASFRFYDEDGRLVRVYVKDCIHTEMLGYRYKKMPLPWLNRRPRKLPRSPKPRREPALEATFPTLLKGPINTTVPVPKKTKPDDESVLVVKVTHDRAVYIKFDVYVNAEDTQTSRIGPADKAGNFVHIPLTQRDNNILTSYTKLEISELLEDIGADNDDEVQITIVPRKGKNKATIESVNIQTSCDV